MVNRVENGDLSFGTLMIWYINNFAFYLYKQTRRDVESEVGDW